MAHYDLHSSSLHRKNIFQKFYNFTLIPILDSILNLASIYID